MFGIGTREIIIIAVILILLFGSSRIPALAKSITDAIKHLRGAFDDKEESQDSSNQITINKKKK